MFYLSHLLDKELKMQANIIILGRLVIHYLNINTILEKIIKAIISITIITCISSCAVMGGAAIG